MLEVIDVTLVLEFDFVWVVIRDQGLVAAGSLVQQVHLEIGG